MFEIIHFPCTGLHFHEALGLTIYCSLLVIVLEFHQNNSGNANITKFNTKWQNAKYDNLPAILTLSVREGLGSKINFLAPYGQRDRVKSKMAALSSA